MPALTIEVHLHFDPEAPAALQTIGPVLPSGNKQTRAPCTLSNDRQSRLLFFNMSFCYSAAN